MNNDPSSSASASADPDRLREDAVPEDDRKPTEAEIAERRKKNRENFNKRRGELLDDLVRNLDILVYAELSAIYYMDCSILRFAFRGLVQLIFLTPKPALFPEPPSGNRPYIGAIFGSSLLCLLLHAILSAPVASDATRGYLHGSLAMDFIGQKGPTSKLLLLLLDLVVLVLQIVQLSVHLLRLRLKDGTSEPVSITTSTGTQYGARPVSTGQNLDDEERGVRHSAEQVSREDIEMQTLNPAGALAVQAEDADVETSSDSDALLEVPPQRTDAHIFDAFNSGQIVIADLDLWKTVKEQFIAFQKTPQDSDTAAARAEVNRVMRQRLTRRMMNLDFTRGRTI